MTKPEARRDADSDHISGRPVFVARRGDGFGERLRAMLNAMVAARLLPGTFRFSWPPAGYRMAAGGGWHSVRPVEQTFAPEFVAAWHMAPEEAARLDPAPLAAVSDMAGPAYLVEQGSLDQQAPGSFPGWQEELPGCFDDIAFAPDLEHARSAAATTPGDFGETTALHLRAGDVVYGRARKAGHFFINKACPWPVADAICADLAARGHSILLFGQDEPLIDWLCQRHGARSAAGLSRHHGFDAAQQALFEICLMARCASIVCGSSGFARVAALIGARPMMSPYRYFKGATTRSLLVEAALSAPPDQRISALQHAFACNAAIRLRANDELGDATGRALLEQAQAADPENDFFRILRGVADIRAGDAAAFETRLHDRLAQGADTVREVLAVVGAAHHRNVPTLAPVLADLEAAARSGGALAAWCTAWSHAAQKDRSRATEFAALCQSAAPATGLDLPFPPGSDPAGRAAVGGRAFHGLPLSADALAPDPEYLARFIEGLKVSPSPASLTAIGTGRDGTYLLPDDLEGIVACFSAGARSCKNFEDDLAERYGIASHLCGAGGDAAALQTPLNPVLQTFENLWLDTTGTEDAVSLDDWVARHRPEPGDLILRMDIEGAEWRNLLAASDDTLSRFRILVLRLHGLDQIDRPGVLEEAVLPVLDRLLARFACVHVHPDNARPAVGIHGLDAPVPPRLEVTFLRRDRVDGRTLHPVELPHPLDIPYRDSSQPPLFAGDAFRGRPPSAAEQARMDQAGTDWAQRQQIVELNQRIALLETEKKQSRGHRLRLEKKAAVRETEIRKLKKSLSRLDARARQAEARLTALRGSTSWRLTSPLRWLVQSFRGPSRRDPP